MWALSANSFGLLKIVLKLSSILGVSKTKIPPTEKKILAQYLKVFTWFGYITTYL